MKNKTFTLYTITLLLVGSTIYSCKKDDVKQEINKSIKVEQQQLQAWYEKNADKSESNLFNSMEPEWKGIFMSEDNDLQVFEITLKNPKRVFPASEEINKDQASSYFDKTDTRLVIFKEKATGKITNAAYMAFIANEKNTNLKSLRYKQVQSFDGKVLYYNINGDLINGWQYRQGIISGEISPTTKQAYLVDKESKVKRTGSLNGGGKLMNVTTEPIPGCLNTPLPVYRDVCQGFEPGYMNCVSVFVRMDYITVCPPGFGGGGTGGVGGVGGSDPRSNDLRAKEPLSFNYPVSTATNLKEQFKCFDNIPDELSTYKMSISVDLPVNDDPSKLVTFSTMPPSPGHVFITLTKIGMNDFFGSQRVSKSFGFYPSIDVLSLTAAGVGSQAVDDGGREQNATMTALLSKEDFRKVMDKAIYQAGHQSYDINDYNCTDYAIDVWNAMTLSDEHKLKVPDWIGPTTQFNYGRTPNGLWKVLSQKTGLESLGVDLYKGSDQKAPAKSSTCK